MIACMAGFAFNDAVFKTLSGTLPLYQAIFLRGLVATVLVTALAWHQSALRPSTLKGNLSLISWRTLGEVGATACFLTALFNMPLPNATAIMQSLPLAVTLAASLFLGERVGWQRMSAILIGFVGVLIIVRPGTDGFNVYGLLALAAVGFITLRDLATRRLKGDVPSLLVALITSVAVTIGAGLASLFEGWAALSLDSALRLTLAAFFLLAGYAFSVMTMRVGEVNFVAPFRYTILIWALILGYAVFGDIPDALTWIGALIVVATGLFTFWREQRLKR